MLLKFFLRKGVKNDYCVLLKITFNFNIILQTMFGQVSNIYIFYKSGYSEHNMTHILWHCIILSLQSVWTYNIMTHSMMDWLYALTFCIDNNFMFGRFFSNIDVAIRIHRVMASLLRHASHFSCNWNVSPIGDIVKSCRWLKL